MLDRSLGGSPSEVGRRVHGKSRPLHHVGNLSLPQELASVKKDGPGRNRTRDTTLDEALCEFRHTADARVSLEGDNVALRAEIERLRGLAPPLEEVRSGIIRLQNENDRLRRQVANLTRELGALRLNANAPRYDAGGKVGDGAAEGGVEEVTGPGPGEQVRDFHRRGLDRETVAAVAEARGRHAVARGGPILDGQLPGPSRQVRPACAVGRRLVPSRYRDASGEFQCPGCEWRSRQRSHAERHFRTRHEGVFFEAFEEEGERRRANDGRGRRERRRRQVRGLMAFVVEEEEVEYDDVE